METPEIVAFKVQLGFFIEISITGYRTEGGALGLETEKLKPNKNVAFPFLYIQAAGKIEKLDQR